ncbi:MAG: hypothetical protein WA210_09090 [Burkholderiaceae bacterium]
MPNDDALLIAAATIYAAMLVSERTRLLADPVDMMRRAVTMARALAEIAKEPA